MPGDIFMPPVRINAQPLGSRNPVVRSELRAWRAYFIHQRNRHQRSRSDTGRKILHVDITQVLKDFIFSLMQRIKISKITTQFRICPLYGSSAKRACNHIGTDNRLPLWQCAVRVRHKLGKGRLPVSRPLPTPAAHPPVAFPL